MGYKEKNVFVMGATGFVGREIVQRFASRGARVVAVGRSANFPVQAAVTVSADLSDPSALAALMNSYSPHLIIHSAARMSAPPGDERLFFDDNLGMTLSMIAALQQSSTPPRLLVVGSAAQYGLGTPSGRATRETDSLQPVSAYGASKAAAMLAAMAAGISHSLDIVGVVPFNLIGARQSRHLVPATFARSALENPGHPIAVGSVEAQRDFLDVRDAAAAIEAVALQGRPRTVYNVGSGVPVKIGEILALIAQRLGPSFAWNADEGRCGPGRVPVSYADISRIGADTGWKPQIPLEQAINDMIDAMGDECSRICSEKGAS